MKHYFVITDYGDFSLGVTQVSLRRYGWREDE